MLWTSVTQILVESILFNLCLLWAHATVFIIAARTQIPAFHSAPTDLLPHSFSFLLSLDSFPQHPKAHFITFLKPSLKRPSQRGLPQPHSTAVSDFLSAPSTSLLPSVVFSLRRKCPPPGIALGAADSVPMILLYKWAFERNSHQYLINCYIGIGIFVCVILVKVK